MDKTLLYMIICVTLLFGTLQKVDAQNVVVDGFKTQKGVEKKKTTRLVLSPNETIKENLKKINEILSLNEGDDYITIEGDYGVCKHIIDFIHIKPQNNYRSINDEIIDALTGLYSISLDKPFDAPITDQHFIGKNEKTHKVPTGRTFKHKNGSITKEYVDKKYPENILFCLYSYSPLYNKIRDKVIEETGLESSKTLYTREKTYREKLEQNNKQYNLPPNAKNQVLDKHKSYITERGELSDTLILYPNDSIEKNFSKIDSLLNLDNGHNHNVYEIFVMGVYCDSKNESREVEIAKITVKRYREYTDGYKMKEEIIKVLTTLYTTSLVPFEGLDKYYDYNIDYNNGAYKINLGHILEKEVKYDVSRVVPFRYNYTPRKIIDEKRELNRKDVDALNAKINELKAREIEKDFEEKKHDNKKQEKKNDKKDYNDVYY